MKLLSLCLIFDRCTFSAKVIAALANCNHSRTKEEAVAELKPLAVNGGLKEVEAFLPLELKQNSEQVSKTPKEPNVLGSSSKSKVKEGVEPRKKKKKI